MDGVTDRGPHRRGRNRAARLPDRERPAGEDFVYGFETYAPGVPFFACYFAATAPPIFTTSDGGRSAVSAGLAGWLDDQVRAGREVSAGRFVEDPGFGL